MSFMQKKVMEKFYREADGRPDKLPWHDETPPPLLLQALEGQRPRTALDVGSGSGVFAAWLAEQGLEVTAIDYIPGAVEMTRAQASARGVDVTVLQADVFDYSPDQPFDLVFDSGCMHNMGRSEVHRYAAGMGRWLRSGGDFVLGHWGRRHALDWRPIGPRRRTEQELRTLFQRRLTLLEVEHTVADVPLPFGPKVQMSSYWFRSA